MDWVFLWLGDVKSLFAMIKQQEDHRNADHDVLDRGVRAIIVVEDDVRFYSFFLPHIYAEVTHQTSRLMAEGREPHPPHPAHAGPAQDPPGPDLRGGLGLFERFGDNLLGIISDVSFPREGRLDPAAGIELARQVRWKNPDLPILLQSTDAVNRRPGGGAGR